MLMCIQISGTLNHSCVTTTSNREVFSYPKKKKKGQGEVTFFIKTSKLVGKIQLWPKIKGLICRQLQNSLLAKPMPFDCKLFSIVS